MEIETTMLLLLSALLLSGEALTHGGHAKNKWTPLSDHMFKSGIEDASNEINVPVEHNYSTTYDTSPEDIDGLRALANQFSLIQLALKNGGDPCGEDELSNLEYWSWLECSNSTPPRVIELNLADCSLGGELPDFSQMQALENIDFSNNFLYGLIPSFLGQFPNLKQLDLSNNQFSGNIPRSILENKNLTYKLDGNPKLDPPDRKKKENLGLLIGLSVGIVFGLLLPVMVFIVLTRRNTPVSRQDVTGTVFVHDTENGSSGEISQEQRLKHTPSSWSHGTDTGEGRN